jgi:chaperonin GroEL
MATKIKFSTDARDAIYKGCETLYKAVSTTLGPKGMNVGIDKKYQRVILHDGVSVAKSMELPDKFENFGLSVMRESAQRTVDQVGDGTTATVILAYSILTEARKLLATGVNAMSLRRELEDAADFIVSKIRKIKTPVENLAQKIQVATISAEDEVLGKLIAETLHSVGMDGIVTVEESKSAETFIEHQKGMLIDKGYASVFFVTDPHKLEATFEDTPVLVTDYDLQSMEELLPFLNKFVDSGNKLLTIIAADYGIEVLQNFIANKRSGNLFSLCTSIPSTGGKMKDILQDIATLTGATLISKEGGKPLDTIEMKDLGRAGRITATRSTTLIVDGKGSKEDIDIRIQSIKEQMKTATEWEYEKLKERLAKLTNGVAVIKVGGATEIEMLERKERCIDAVEATKSAERNGIVAGGEMIFIRATDEMKGFNDGEMIMKRATEAPFKKLLTNANIDPGIMWERLKDKDSKFGVDVNDGKIKDMFKSGIIDPAEVSIQALKNAVSTSILLLTTDCVIVPAEGNDNAGKMPNMQQRV